MTLAGEGPTEGFLFPKRGYRHADLERASSPWPVMRLRDAVVE